MYIQNYTGHMSQGNLCNKKEGAKWRSGGIGIPRVCSNTMTTCESIRVQVRILSSLQLLNIKQN